MIIRESNKLNQAISKWAVLGAKYHDATHDVVCSALWHAAEHGDPVHINRVYEIMTPDQQVTLRTMVQKVHLYFGLDGKMPEGPIEPEAKRAAMDAGKILDVNAGEWRVLNVRDKSTAPQLRKQLTLFVTEVLDEGKNVHFPKFSRVNTIKTIAYVGDKQVLDRIMSAIDLAVKDSTDTRKIQISPRLKKELAIVGERLGKFADARDEDEKPAKRETPKRAQSQAKPRGRKPAAEKTEAHQLNA